MAEIRESFPTLEDGSEVGKVLRVVQEGDAVASINGQLAFAFKDDSANAVAAQLLASGTAPTIGLPVLGAVDDAGNLIEIPVKVAGDGPANAIPALTFLDSTGNLAYVQLNSSGQVPVTTEVSGNGKFARGSSGGSTSQVTVTTLALTAAKKYESIHVLVSCYRDATFQLIWNNAGAETILADLRCGPGSLTQSFDLGELEITTGAGVQQFLIKGINENAASTMTGTVSCKELL